MLIGDTRAALKRRLLVCWYRCAECMLVLVVAPAVVISCDVSFLDETLASLAARRQALAEEGFWRMAASGTEVDKCPDPALVLRAVEGSLQALSRQQQFALKAALRDHGLSRNGWKFLCHHGRDLCWPLRHGGYYCADMAGEIVWHANLYAGLGRAETPPAALVLAVGRMRWRGWLGAGADKLPAVTHLVQAAWARMETLPDTGQRMHFAHDKLMDVADWWLNDADGIPANTSWEWLALQAANARRRAFLATQPCVTFGRPQRILQHHVLPLRTFVELRDAGLSLNNCMCEATPSRAPVHAHFLIADDKDRPVAMFRALPPASSAVAEEVLGQGNQPVSEYFTLLAKLYLLHERRSCTTPEPDGDHAVEPAVAA